MRANFAKELKSLWIFCPRLSENFSFSFYLLKNALKPQELSVFFEQKENLFVDTALRKLRKLRKIAFPIESFTADFCNFLAKNLKIWLLDGKLGTRHQIQAFQGFSGNVLFS